jgi:hypothetical protein
MSVARVVCGALICALAVPLGCGERSGDPVVRLPDGQGDAGQGGTGSPAAAGAAPTGPQGDGGETAGNLRPGPTGLCGECSSSDECGDANDACIRHLDQRFCGRDCDDQRGCPNGYSCVELENSQLWQCVPETGCPEPAVTVPALADIRQYILTRINSERALRDQAPLLASSCLDELAQQSALAFAGTDEPLGKYVKECDPIWPNCACGWSAEAELTVARYGLDWSAAVESAVDPSRDQNDRFTQAFLGLEMTDVGIGFWLSGDEAWIALSLH